LVTIGIITALPHEFGAVKALLENTREHFVDGRGAGRRYWLGEVPAANGGSNTVALALLPDTGNTIASTRATLLLEHFQNAQAIIMTGIAGGVPFPEKAEHHVRLGDIIVSNRYGVVQYDYVKTERCREGEKEWVENTNRHPPRAPSALFLEAAVYLVAGEMEESKPWLRLIQQACERLGIRRPGEETDTLARSDNPEETVPHPRDDAREPGVPRVFRGPIASANVLLKDPIRRDALRDAFGVKAVEMEGSGISDATWTLEEGYFIVRGVCDYCDKNKGDAWQNYAAAAAAGYTITLLRSLPSQGSPGTPAPEPAATKATPCVERLGQLPEPELRRLVTQRMSRKDLAAVWYDTLGGLMDDQMGDKGTGECAIELLTRAKQHGLLRSLFEHICINRPDLAS